MSLERRLNMLQITISQLQTIWVKNKQRRVSKISFSEKLTIYGMERTRIKKVQFIKILMKDV